MQTAVMSGVGFDGKAYCLKYPWFALTPDVARAGARGSRTIARSALWLWRVERPMTTHHP